jgi:hypothetical protein
MFAIDSFGRDQNDMLGAAADAYTATTPDTTSACTFGGYLDARPSPDGMKYAGQAAIFSAVLVGAGFVVGGMVPVVGRPIGALAGAGLAGAGVALGYSKWKDNVSSCKKPAAK